MALYRITSKRRCISNGMILEKGLSVQITALKLGPVSGLYADRINTLFKNAYGLDLKKMNVLNATYLEVEQIG